MAYATLNIISEYLNIGSFAKASKCGIALKFLPDLLDEHILDDQSMAIAWKGSRETDALIHGNFRQKKVLSDIEAGLLSLDELDRELRTYSLQSNTDKLLYAIRDNHIICYKGDLGSIHCRENMYHKIHYIISQTSPHKIKALFQELEILPFHNEELRKHLRKIIWGLHDAKYNEYALFLLVLTSIFRDKMALLENLYDAETIRNEVASAENVTTLPDNWRYFTDETYMHEYQVFMYQPSTKEDRLYQRGWVKLECRDGWAPPLAEMKLWASASGQPTHYYSGIPVLLHDKTVYISMNDDTQDYALGILCFEYEQFTDGRPMYFRQGLFISCDFRYHTPQVQKVAIVDSAIAADASFMSTIKGFLKTNASKIVYKLSELNEFYNYTNYSNESWSPKFAKYMYPWLLAQQSYSCCTEDELLNFARGDFTSEELLRVTYAFKHFMESKWMHKDNTQNCTPPEDFHYVFAPEIKKQFAKK